jgi:hypothetical protein
LTVVPTAVRAPARTRDDSILLWRCAILGGALVICAPLLVSDLPQMGDYLNHLARMYVMTHVRADPILARMYDVAWGIVPNLGMDLVVPTLSALMPLDVAGRIFIALALVLPVTGAIALHRAAFGGRSFWPLSALLVAYNGLFFWGFLNFVVGIGLALWATALWLRRPTQGRAWHLAAVSAMALALFACHLEALALFGVTVGSIELARLYALRTQGALTVGTATRSALRLAVPFAIPLLLFLFATRLGHVVTGKPALLQLKEYYWAVLSSYHQGKLQGLAMPFASYSPALDVLAVTAIVLLYLLQIRRGGCRVQAGLLLAAAGLLLMYPLVPSVWLTAANIDSRLPVYAALLALGGIAPEGPPARDVRVATVAVAVLLLARVAVVAGTWAGANPEIAQFRRVITAIAPGQRVIVVVGDPKVPPAGGAYHGGPITLVPLLTIDRQAFWPTLFASRTLQPLHVKPPFLDISVDQAEAPPVTALVRPTQRTLTLTPYVRDWRSHFDYLLLVGAADLPPDLGLPPEALQRLDGTENFALFAIRK